MLDSAPFKVWTWKNQWNYASFNVTLIYFIHEHGISLTLDNWGQKYRETLGNKPLLAMNSTLKKGIDRYLWFGVKTFMPCAARTIIFPQENFNYLIVCFTRCTLFFNTFVFYCRFYCPAPLPFSKKLNSFKTVQAMTTTRRELSWKLSENIFWVIVTCTLITT